MIAPPRLLRVTQPAAPLLAARTSQARADDSSSQPSQPRPCSYTPAPLLGPMLAHVAEPCKAAHGPVQHTTPHHAVPPSGPPLSRVPRRAAAPPHRPACYMSAVPLASGGAPNGGGGCRACARAREEGFSASGLAWALRLEAEGKRCRGPPSPGVAARGVWGRRGGVAALRTLQKAKSPPLPLPPRPCCGAHEGARRVRRPEPVPILASNASARAASAAKWARSSAVSIRGGVRTWQADGRATGGGTGGAGGCLLGKRVSVAGTAGGTGASARSGSRRGQGAPALQVGCEPSPSPKPAAPPNLTRRQAAARPLSPSFPAPSPLPPPHLAHVVPVARQVQVLWRKGVHRPGVVNDELVVVPAWWEARQLDQELAYRPRRAGRVAGQAGVWGKGGPASN